MGWLVLLVGACEGQGTTVTQGPTDADGDGSPATVDCQDEDTTVHPGADEVCDDGIDNNCDTTAVGCQWSGTRTLGPGGAEAALVGAEVDAALGSVVTSLGDIDGDGLADWAASAPGHADRLGEVQIVAGGRVRVLDAGADDAQLGYALLGGVDVTGDGAPDLIVSSFGPSWYEDGGVSFGAVSVLASPEAGLADAFAVVEGRPVADWFGREVAHAAGGDGAEVLLVGATDAVFGFPTPLSPGATGAEDAGFGLAGAGLGAAITAGDFNGDGVDEVAAACSIDGWGGGEDGRIFLIPSGPVGTWAVEAAADTILVVEDGTGSSLDALATGDLDGDGREDLVAGVDELPFGDADHVGAAYVLTDPGAVTSLVEAEVQIRGEAEEDHVGLDVAVPGDLDGDGRDDLVVGAMRGLDGPGTALVFYGPVLAAVPDAEIVGSEPWEGLGGAIGGAGDVDGDGHDDLLLGAPGYGDDAGIVWLVHGRGL